MQKAREKKERAGAKYLYAEVICTSPYILYDTLSSGYFWVNDRQYLDNLWVAAMGYVKLTGNYRTYNGITCAECNSVKVVNKSSGIQTKIDSKKKALKKYKNALKDKVSLQNAKVKAGKTVKIIKEWKYSGAYNALAWKSSDEDIASVDANGKVTAYKEGTVTISAKAGVSGITGKCKVTVWEEDTAPSQDQEEEYGGTWEDAGGSADQAVTESEMHFERQDYYLEDARSATLYLYVNLKEGDDPGSISVTSSDENVAVFSEGGRDRDNRCVLLFTLTGAGTTTVTATAVIIKA